MAFNGHQKVPSAIQRINQVKIALVDISFYRVVMLQRLAATAVVSRQSDSIRDKNDFSHLLLKNSTEYEQV